MWKVGIIGCGPRGLVHAQAVRRVEGLELTAVADLSEPARQAASRDLGVPGLASLGQLLETAQPQIVVLATTMYDRAVLADQAVRFGGVRALVLEKPFACGLAQARHLTEICEQADVTAVICHQLRFIKEFVALKDAINNGEVGALRSLDGSCYGNLLNQGTHILDMIAWLLGPRRPKWVMSQWCDDPSLLARLAPGTNPVQDKRHPSPRWMQSEIEFDGGVHATARMGVLYPRSDVFVDDWLQKRVAVVGSEGFAEAQSAGFFRIRSARGGAPRTIRGSVAEYQQADDALYRELIESLEKGKTHRNSIRDALGSFELLIACGQSAVDGKPVAWPPDQTRDVLAEVAALCGQRPEPGTAVKTVPVAAGKISAKPDDAPVVSVVLPLFDHRGHGLKCVECWSSAQDLPRDRYEVIVLSNGSEPLESRLNALFGPGDRLILHQTDNVMQLYDIGARAARGRWLLFTEAHCLAEPGCLAELVKYLDNSGYDGACLRSTPGCSTALARMEDRLFNEGFAVWSRPEDWRKVIVRGFAVARQVYLDDGGFEYRYDRFSEWALAATLHRRGRRLGYAAAASVKHYNTIGFSALFPPVWEFSQGECAYRAEHDEPFVEQYFGFAPAWSQRESLRRTLARAACGAAWRSLWSDGRGSSLRQKLALLRAQLGELTRWLRRWLIGPRGPVAWAWLALKLEEARCHLLWWSPERQFRSYARAYQCIVDYARADYVARHLSRPPPDLPALDEYDMGNLPENQLIGFHGLESWRGRKFRWTGTLAIFRFHLEPGDYRVAIDTGSLRGETMPFPLGLRCNRHTVRPSEIVKRDGRITFQISREMFVPGREQRLVINTTSLPTGIDSPKDPRALGVAVFGVHFTPAGAATHIHPANAAPAVLAAGA